jgi:cell division protein ZapA (FtsZ GTPase activity inhibitor)
VKKSYEVTILNQKFVLKTDNDEAHVKRVADYINKTFHDIQQRTQTISTQNVAILGALNVAEEMFNREEKFKTMVGEWRQRLHTAVAEEAAPAVPPA